VTHLASLRAGEEAQGSEFHYCDDVTSGLAAGYCAGHASSITQAERDAELVRLAAGWSADERAAFARLREAFESYAEAHANSGDMTGTLRMALWISAREGARDEFLATLRRLEAREVPSAAAAQFRTADAALNSAWRALMRSELPNQGIGGPTARACARRSAHGSAIATLSSPLRRCATRRSGETRSRPCSPAAHGAAAQRRLISRGGCAAEQRRAGQRRERERRRRFALRRGVAHRASARAAAWPASDWGAAVATCRYRRSASSPLP
jgi:hypothetical protein